MQIEIRSLVIGCLLGAILASLGTLALGPVVFPREAPADNSVLMAGLERCQAKYPVYVSRIGAIVRVACNGHREGRE